MKALAALAEKYLQAQQEAESLAELSPDTNRQVYNLRLRNLMSELVWWADEIDAACSEDTRCVWMLSAEETHHVIADFLLGTTDPEAALRLTSFGRRMKNDLTCVRNPHPADVPFHNYFEDDERRFKKLAYEAYKRQRGAVNNG